MKPPGSPGLRLRRFLLWIAAAAVLAVWAFPVLWGLLTSFKSERDVLAYPPLLVFKPTLDNYRAVISGSSSILHNLQSSMVVSTLATLLTMSSKSGRDRASIVLASEYACGMPKEAASLSARAMSGSQIAVQRAPGASPQAAT